MIYYKYGGWSRVSSAVLQMRKREAQRVSGGERWLERPVKDFVKVIIKVASMSLPIRKWYFKERIKGEGNIEQKTTVKKKLFGWQENYLK